MKDAATWTVNNSRVVVKDKWISLRADDCVTASGIAVAPYYVQENPEWVSVVAMDRNQRVVLIREYHHGAGIVGLGLPGGAVDPKDSSFDEAVRRELREETGYEAGELHSLGHSWANWNSQSNRVHFYLALDCELTADPNPDEAEDIAVSLLPLDEFHPKILDQGYHRLNAYMATEQLRSRS
ncbi:NUDIX hydrolase [Paenarthrobacter sp. NPDC089316]|uniref:NUDIX hydrolase n=1 Tax=unclassified Paenarthrobacter TaxID=2634190 RepID=UPI0034135A01